MVEILSPTPVSSYMTQFESLKAIRVPFDTKRQMVSDFILPGRDFSVTATPGQLRPSRVVSSVATNANNRLAALLLSYAFDTSQPFLTPNVKRGLAQAGRDTNLGDDAADYLLRLQWTVFDHLSLPKAMLAVRFNAMLKEFCGFGDGVMWTGRRRGFGPYFNTRPVQACWWSENEEGCVDTLYYRMLMPIYRVRDRWPAATALNGWKDEDIGPAKAASEQTLTPILIACRPRRGGQYGAVVEAKPFELTTIAEEKKAILEVSGYDTFPYAVFRYDPMPGQAYSYGPGCQVLPDIMVLNHLQQAIENSASQRAEPAIAVPARMFGRSLDRRPGAVNSYNPAGLGLASAKEAIIKLDMTGDITDAMAVKKSLIDDIELGYYTDWLRLRESGDMTAEEVGERRDLRLRGASSIVANMSLPLTQLGDRAMEILGQEGVIDAPPAQLGGMDVDWEYSGPLAIAQLSGNVRAIIQLLNVRALVAKDDPAAAMAVDLEESLRGVASGLGTPTKTMTSRASVQQFRDAQNAQAAQQHEAAMAQAAAATAKNAGAGMASAANAGQTQQEAPPAAAGAPSAPFAPAAAFAPSLAAA